MEENVKNYGEYLPNVQNDSILYHSGKTPQLVYFVIYLSYDIFCFPSYEGSTKEVLSHGVTYIIL